MSPAKISEKLRPALLCVLLLVGCYNTFGSDPSRDGDGDNSAGDDDDASGIPDSPPVALQCVAEASNVSVPMGQPETVQLSAIASYEDGSSSATAEVSWAVQDGFGGSINSAGLYTTPANHGGLVRVEALHEATMLSAECSMEIHLEATDNLTGTPSLDLPLHGVSTNVDDSCAPVLSYPIDGSVLARDLAPPQFMWTVPGTTNTSVLVLSTEYVTLSVISHDTSWTPDSGQWFALTEPNAGEVLSVRVVAGNWDNGLDAFSEPPCEASSQVQFEISQFGFLGSVYYWNISTEGLWRVGIGSSEAQPWLGSGDVSYCVGCHSANLGNPDRMAVNYGGGNGWGVVLEVASPLSPVVSPDTRNGNFFALNPAGTRLIRSFQGVLYLDDVDANIQLGTLPTSGYASHPDWSPDGSSIVYSSCGSSDNQRDWEVWNCAIHQIDVLSDGSFGADTPLVPADSDWNYYYPSFSPDSAWVSFNRHAGNSSSNHSYNNGAAEVMLVPAWGGAPIALQQASLPAQGNSWPRWGPGQGDHSWLAFSSRRPYGNLTNGNAQIWVSAIDLNLAVQGVDPSAPPLWLPGQDVTGSNHTPVWVPRDAGR